DVGGQGRGESPGVRTARRAVVRRRLHPRRRPVSCATVRATILGTVLLLGCLAWLHPGPAQAERSSIPGNAGTITVDWLATQDRHGRPLIEGQVIPCGAMSGYGSWWRRSTPPAKSPPRTWDSSRASSAASTTCTSRSRFAPLAPRIASRSRRGR